MFERCFQYWFFFSNLNSFFKHIFPHRMYPPRQVKENTNIVYNFYYKPTMFERCFQGSFFCSSASTVWVALPIFVILFNNEFFCKHKVPHRMYPPPQVKEKMNIFYNFYHKPIMFERCLQISFFFFQIRYTFFNYKFLRRMYPPSTSERKVKFLYKFYHEPVLFEWCFQVSFFCSIL